MVDSAAQAIFNESIASYRRADASSEHSLEALSIFSCLVDNSWITSLPLREREREREVEKAQQLALIINTPINWTLHNCRSLKSWPIQNANLLLVVSLQTTISPIISKLIHR
jgi:hypothetical protein